jgi:hypothetical protein
MPQTAATNEETAATNEESRRHLEGDAHQTNGFLVEPMVVQVAPDWHRGALRCPARRSPTAASSQGFNRNLPAVKVREVATNECAGRYR